MAGWLERQDVIWERGDHSGIALETASGEVHTMLSTTDETSVEVSVRGQVTNTVFQPATDYTLLREELSIPGRDPIYEQVLPRAVKLAKEFGVKR
jgi:hypothetical protein